MKETPENTPGSNTLPTELTDDSKWWGGWYQPIEFPDGTKTLSTRDKYFFERESLGKRKWDLLIAPNLPKGESFLDIGCNAGIHLALADYKKLYGIERHEQFYKQCLYVLEKFGKQAEIMLGDALDLELPQVDVTLMANTLYWVGYGDNEQFIDNYEEEVDRFLKKLSHKTKWLVLVGSESLAVDRIGGSLARTLPLINKYFTVTKAEKVMLDRELNIVVCQSNLYPK